MRVGGMRKTPQVFDDEQRVLIHRVDVKEVVLHLPYDRAENGEETSENPPGIHVFQTVVRPVGELKNLQKELFIDRVIAIGGVNRVAGMPQYPQETRRQCL